MSSTAPVLPTAPARARLLELLRRSTRLDHFLRLLRRMNLELAVDAGERVAPGVRLHTSPGIVPFLLFEFDGPAGPEHILARLSAHARAPTVLCAALLHATRSVAFGCRGADGEFRIAIIERLAPREADVLLLQELSRPEATVVGRLVRWTRALDRVSIGARFFRDVRAQRDAIATAWTGLPARARRDREQLALLFISRILFLAFLQERGHLLGDREFLAAYLRGAASIYRERVAPLFFEVFNRRPELRTGRGAEFADLPYLNGGLFEPHVLEQRHTLDLPDRVVLGIVDTLLLRYRFSARDAAEAVVADTAEAGIDPEMLGRVFESLMAEDKRSASGSFYTPAPVVDDLLCRSLAELLADRCQVEFAAALGFVRGTEGSAMPAGAKDVLRAMRVLDPSCGSGAFLLSALTRLTALRSAVQPRCARALIRQDVVARALHGVDILDDAALLCCLRLWLALAPGAGESVEPLPNLDRRIRQGDALIDPLDLIEPANTQGSHRGAALAPEVRRSLRTLQPLARAYVTADPEERRELQRQLRDAELALAGQWLDALHARIERELRESEARADYRDLWGEASPRGASVVRQGSRLRRRLEDVTLLRRELEEKRTLPFFSFLVHFPSEAPGFDLVIGNPPWVRAHRWPETVAGAVRERFRVCTSAPAGQVDLALLFLERGLKLLAPRGVLAMLLPAKLLRSLSAGGARALLHEHTVLEIDDHGLDQHSVFRADAFTTALIVRGDAPVDPARVRIRMRARGRDPLEFEVARADLPLFPDDPRSAWLLAPPDVLRLMRQMQRTGATLGARYHIRRGIVTGANDVFVVPSAEHKLAGLSRVRTQGYFRARRNGDAGNRHSGWIETSCLRPLLRGADVRAWRWSTPQRLLWAPCNDRPGASAPARLGAFLSRHPNIEDGGRLRRVHPDMFGDKVVWQDIATDLNAAAVSARVRGDDGREVPVIPLNTVYYAAARSEREALLLSALLNSLPLRTFARTLAERAKDAHFRFFAGTVAALPVPTRMSAAVASQLVELATAAHAGEAIGLRQLDLLAARAYGLDAAALDVFAEFSAWMSR